MDSPDPLVMDFLVAKDRPLGLDEAVVVAGAAAATCEARFAGRPEHAEAFRAWRSRQRKIALRCAREELEDLLAGGDHVLLDTSTDGFVCCLPPRQRSTRPPAVQALRPFTDAPRPDAPLAPPPEGVPVVRYVTREGLMRSAGKAMAQAGHAALGVTAQLRRRDPAALDAWADAGWRGTLEVVDDAAWAELRGRPDVVVVSDAGLTQVAPGTETVLAVPPRAPGPATRRGLLARLLRR